MKPLRYILLVLIGMGFDLYAIVQNNALFLSGMRDDLLKHAVLLLLSLFIAAQLCRKLCAQKNSRMLRGIGYGYLIIHTLICLGILENLYFSVFLQNTPGEWLAHALVYRSFSAFSQLLWITVLLILLVFWIMVSGIHIVYQKAGAILWSVMFLWLCLDMAFCVSDYVQSALLMGEIYRTICMLLPLLLLHWIAAGGQWGNSLLHGFVQGLIGGIQLYFATLFIPYARIGLLDAKNSGLDEQTFLRLLLACILLVGSVWMGITGIYRAFVCFKQSISKAKKRINAAGGKIKEFQNDRIKKKRASQNKKKGKKQNFRRPSAQEKSETNANILDDEFLEEFLRELELDPFDKRLEDRK